MQRRLGPLPSTPVLWRWSAAGVALGVLVACVAFAPARWLAHATHALSQGHVQLLESTGTVWDGDARLLLTGGEGSHSAASLPGRLHWTSRLHWNALELELQAPCCTVNALQLRLQPWLQAAPSMVGWTLEAGSHQSDWPADLLSGLGTPWNTVRPEGTLHLNTPGLKLTSASNHWSLQGSVALDAQVIASRLSTLHPLGHYRLDLRGGTTPELTLSTLDGALQVQGQGQHIAGQWRFQGQAQATPEHAPELDNLLNILGRRQGARSLITLG